MSEERREMQLPDGTGGLKCGHCGKPLTSVSKVTNEGGSRFRRRMCECGHVNITVEQVRNSYEVRRYFSGQ